MFKLNQTFIMAKLIVYNLKIIQYFFSCLIEPLNQINYFLKKCTAETKNLSSPIH